MADRAPLVCRPASPPARSGFRYTSSGTWQRLMIPTAQQLPPRAPAPSRAYCRGEFMEDKAFKPQMSRHPQSVWHMRSAWHITTNINK